MLRWASGVAEEAGEALRAWLMSAEKMSLAQRFVVGTKAMVTRGTMQLAVPPTGDRWKPTRTGIQTSCRRTVLGPTIGAEEALRRKEGRKEGRKEA
jgi:hypothetical protein